MKESNQHEDAARKGVPIQITATVGAYLADPGSNYRGHGVLLAALQEPAKHRSIVGSLLAYSGHDMSQTWQRVGDAQITVTLDSYDEQVASAIQALKAKIEKARAEFLTMQSEVLEQISKLQAIEYVGEAA